MLVHTRFYAQCRPGHIVKMRTLMHISYLPSKYRDQIIQLYRQQMYKLSDSFLLVVTHKLPVHALYGGGCKIFTIYLR